MPRYKPLTKLLITFFIFDLFSAIETKLPVTTIASLNSIKGLDPTIKNLSCCSVYLYCGKSNRYVQRLRINNKNLDGVIRVLSCFKMLRALELNDDKITNINGIQKLQSLEILSLAGNDLAQVDQLQCIASKLQYLDLSFNALARIPVLRSLRNLKEFRCRSCSLVSVPNIKNLKKLKTLDLSNNLLTSVPGLRELKGRLKAIYLAGNPILCSNLNKYYGNSECHCNDRAISEANCRLTCDCPTDKVMVKTFGGPVCVSSPCKFGMCQIFNSYLGRIACNSPIYTNAVDAIKECCKCDECDGITYRGGNFQMRSFPLRQSLNGDTTVLRVAPENCVPDVPIDG